MVRRSFEHHVVTDASDDVVIVLTGDIDMSAAGELRVVLDEVLANDRDVCVDVTRVDLIDSSGLRELLRAQALAARRQHTFSVSSPTPIVRRVLEVADAMGLVADGGRIAGVG